MAVRFLGGESSVANKEGTRRRVKEKRELCEAGYKRKTEQSSFIAATSESTVTAAKPAGIAPASVDFF